MATGELAAAFEASGSVSRHGPKGLVASSLPALAQTVGLQVGQLCVICNGTQANTKQKLLPD